jgi:hypothetical protein
MAFGMNIAINNTQIAILEEGIDLALKQLRLFQDDPIHAVMVAWVDVRKPADKAIV